MSSQANFFIEVRNTETGKWEKLKAYYPFKKRTYKAYDDVNAQWYDKDTTPDLEAGERGFTEMHKLWKQGSIRDLFSSRTMFIDNKFSDRGLPDDLSDDVRAWFDRELAEQQRKDKEHEEKYGSKPFGAGKWWWGESYATLSELEEHFDKIRENWEKNVRKELTNIKKVSDYNKIFSAINDVLKAVGGTPKKVKDEGFTKEDLECAEEGLDYYLTEEIFDVFNLWAFICAIEDIVEAFSNGLVSSSDIRVIVYCS